MIGITNSDGGSQRHILELSKRIGCDLITDKGVASSFAGNMKFALHIYFLAIWGLMFGKKKYDVIHIHENLLYFLAFNPILQFRYQIVITVHGLKGFKFYDCFWWPFSFALSCADKVIAVNKADQILLASNPKFYNLKIHVPSTYIPNGVDLSIYKDINPLVEQKITFIGRIHEQKGLDILCEAFKDIQEVELEIIGDNTGDYALELKKRYDNLSTVWRGSIKDRAEIVRSLKSAYMIVLPSRWEGLPLTLFEGLASGRPMIVSDIPAFKSVVTENEVLFFSSENVEDLKEKILKLLSRNELAYDLGQQGKRLAEDYDWNIIAEKTKEIYG